MGSYEDERHWPQHIGAIRSHLRLTFNGGSLKMPGHGLSYPAVSGRHRSGGFDYAKERQKLRNEGPIPEGVYWVAPGELWSNDWYRPAASASWGKYRLAIHPFPETETHGRGGFFIHGGTAPGSAGCIDLWAHMDSFVDGLKQAVDGASNIYCILTVSYFLDHRK
ncbi:MAG TPA: tlde1 domain-containing protein [Luteibacter sp.]|uniref:tlde1 domain-containing protein n=1 Tax=Luteibacter sp. TaxID=1886636 RepID=UPI002B53F08C|nr:tlde1 domain-containing protein [Luteibacter sp.]HVI56543.1 tlde1 domain-containing protein [Luteibacter sp.]